MISFVIPVFNSEKTIVNCLNSIQKQTYRDIEIIVIDDGSSDGSFKLVEELQRTDERIKLIKQTNRGVSYTRNKGIELASGEYIQFVDSDDEIDAYMSEKMLDKMIEEDLDLCMCLFDYSDKEARLIEGFCLETEDALNKYMEILLNNVLLQGPCNKIYKRELISQIRFPLNFSKLEDSIFNISYIAQCKRIGLIPEKLYMYNYVQGSLSRRVHEDEIEALICFYKKFDLITKEKSLKKRIFTYAIKQIEALYRVTWISMQENNESYYRTWKRYQNDMKVNEGYALIDPYISHTSIKNRFFWWLITKDYYKLSIVYFKVIEKIKKVIKR